MTSQNPTAETFLRAANMARHVGEDALAEALMRAMRRHADTLPEIDTRHALPEACEVDEPSIGDEPRVDSDRSPRGADVFRSAT